MNNENNHKQTYTPKIKTTYGISPLWILPLVTLCLAGWLVYQAIQESGHRIQIYFSDAQGLVEGRTPIRYQGLEIGMVRRIKLTQDTNNIYVEAEIYPEATYLLTPTTKFWLVKPTATLSGVSGLDALVSGNYIGIQPGIKQDDESFDPVFYALKTAPIDLKRSQGLNITLRAHDLGGINIGSKILYKKIPIGEIYSYRLDSDAKSVLLLASIQDEYRQLINNRSRFWNVTSLRTEINYQGLEVQLEGLSALLNGAIAVDSPEGGQSIQNHTEFQLYSDLKSAGRGIPIQIALPENNQIKNNSAPIMYRGIQIGQITNVHFDQKRKTILADAAIQPAFNDLLNTGSNFVLEEATLSFAGVANVANYIKGNFLTLVPGTGSPSRVFHATRTSHQPPSDAITVTLHAQQTYGLEAGNKVKYRGISVGQITDIRLNQDDIRFTIYIDRQYQYLLKDKNRFYVTGSASASLTDTGVMVDLPSAKELLVHTISFISEGKAYQHLSGYRLYPNQETAALAQDSEQASQVYTLVSSQPPPLTKNAPVLYRNIIVGHVKNFRLSARTVLIDLQIDHQYQHLITQDTVFWNTSGLEMNASLQGVTLKTAPISSLVNGGIAFDALTGTQNRQDKYWVLYPDYERASHAGQLVCLNSESTYQVVQGTPIQFHGVKVGEVRTVQPDFQTRQVNICADIYPEYTTQIARQGSYFWVTSGNQPITRLKNIKSALIQSIDVFPGEGQPLSHFMLHTLPFQPSGLHLTLQSNQMGSIETGAPVTFRGMNVGRITRVRLGELSDRVLIDLNIRPEYAYLVRKNSIFWNQSGIDVSIGLAGADIKTGSLDSLLQGGVAFNTPEAKQLAPPAANLDTFFLNPAREAEWSEWNQPIPKPHENRAL
ncbi:MlaD family protein [Vibrio mangrovi]|uniref:MlaD family protein n=1 Tax=Vibrio mangrovi TaxID=474394 RepID=A0A1Y6INQ7_9VIBR|nr:MlaD family protein [Vibrio mangrovi]MDW6003928.1 MlaD family protein [Vibrio mangrovi]SMR99277.1 Paraquat-inducible protein B [Vibrio mangrovi]